MNRTSKAPTADIASVLWCFSKLDDPHAKPTTAPSAGAWTMLLWAREVRDRFYIELLPKALVESAKSEGPPESSGEPPDITREELLDEYYDYESVRMRMKVFGISDQLIADGETLVTDWAREVGTSLSPECRTALISTVTEF